ncbi:MAG TPA: hypothetical protein VKB31_09010 [Trueperaceae bacterium]|nr:hypothetical protein [Trueperaceae bacterium]
MRFPALEHYLRAPSLETRRAAAVLRAVYAAMFLGQMVIALGLAVVVRLAVHVHTRPSPLLGWVLVGLSCLELPLGVLLAGLAGRGEDRRRALSAALLGAVILSTPAWFAALALATGQTGTPVLLLWGLLALFYAIGVGGVGRLAAQAAQGPPSAPS